MNWRFWSRRERLRGEASDWLARLGGPDAERHRPAFERWILENPDHADAYHCVRAAWGLSDDIRYTATGRARNLTALSPPRSRLVPYALAATALLALAAGMVVLIMQSSTSGPATNVAPVQFATSLGQIRSFSLSDGSTVTLDTNSAIEVDFTGTVRQIRLVHGRARFDVAHNPARPFQVTTNSGMVTARGTLFDVAEVDGQLSVVLLRGAVDVQILTTAPEARAARVVQLRPGQQLTIGSQIGAPTPVIVSEPRWPSGMLEFNRAPLREAIAEANRYGTVPIRLADPTLGDLRVTGVYRAGDTIGLARTLAATFGLRHTSTGDGAILLSRPDAR